jgi:hypothetical protein
VCWNVGRDDIEVLMMRWPLFGKDRGLEEHRTVVITELDRGTVRVVCRCDWRSEAFDAIGSTGRAEALERATEVADVHKWDADLSRVTGVSNPAPAGFRRR